MPNPVFVDLLLLFELFIFQDRYLELLLPLEEIGLKRTGAGGFYNQPTSCTVKEISRKHYCFNENLHFVRKFVQFFEDYLKTLKFFFFLIH